MKNSSHFKVILSTIYLCLLAITESMETTIIPEATTESIATTIMPDPSPSDPIEDSEPVSEPAEIG